MTQPPDRAERFPEDDPRHHTSKVAAMLDDVAAHLRENVRKVSDPRAQALFETAAEVLGGLRKAFADYERGNEPAWRE